AENAKVKQHYKELYDSIKITRAKTIDQNNSLLSEIENLKAQLKDNSKCVTILDSKPKVLVPGIYPIDVEPIPPRHKNNREVHLVYIKHLKESVETLREIVEDAKVERPLDTSLASACRVKGASAASRSKPRSNTKKDRTLPAKSALKQVEAHSRMNKSNEKQKNRVDSSISYKRTIINSNSNTSCKTCNKCLIFANHDQCVVRSEMFVKQSPATKVNKARVTPSDIQHFAAYSDLRVLQIGIRAKVIEKQVKTVMSSASSAVTYTSVYTDFEPGRAFWGTDDEEISEEGIPRTLPVHQDEDEREPMFVHAHDPDYVPEPIYPEYIPLEDDHEFPAKEQPLPVVDLPTAESPIYVTESDPEEDPEEYEDDETEDGSVDYPMDGGDDGDDDDGDSSRDDANDEDKDDEEGEEEEEHLAPLYIMADVNASVKQAPALAPPTHTDEQILPRIRWIIWGVINRAHIDYAERMWEEFTQSIHTFTEDKKNMTQHTLGKKKATLIVIPSVRFTKLIIFYLQHKHKFHPRPESPLHLPTEEPILGYLKFSAKGTKREVFGMPIPNELITDDIRGTDYYNAYLKKVQANTDILLVAKKRTLKRSLQLIDEVVDEGIPLTEPGFDDLEADTQSLTESDTESDEEVPPVVKSGAPDEGQAGPNPGNDIRGPQTLTTPVIMLTKPLNTGPVLRPTNRYQVHHNEKIDEEFTATAYPNIQENLKLTVDDPVIPEEPVSSTGTLSSLQHLAKDFSFGDQFFNDKPSEANNEKTTADTEAESMVSITIHQDTSVIPPMTSPVIDLVSVPDSPTVHQTLPTTTAATATTTTTTILTTIPLPPQPQQVSLDSILLNRLGELEQHITDLVDANQALEERLDKHGSRLYRLENQDIPNQVSKAVDEIVTDAVDWAMHAPLRECFRDLPEADMKEILHNRIDQLPVRLGEARKKKKKRQGSPKTSSGSPPHPPPPPPPPAGPSGTLGASSTSGSSQSPKTDHDNIKMEMQMPRSSKVNSQPHAHT
ncbi:hypothetical protein Tco_1484751, partial [Tanacetum coccineum]